MPATYKVTRHGTFKAKVDTHNQCGVKGTTKFDYVVVVEGTKLDEEGVLIEHFKLDEAIRTTFGAGKWRGTCEQFAGVIVGLVFKQIGDRAKDVHVTLKPGAIAQIDLSWERYHGLPTPAIRVDADFVKKADETAAFNLQEELARARKRVKEVKEESRSC